MNARHEQKELIRIQAIDGLVIIIFIILHYKHCQI